MKQGPSESKIIEQCLREGIDLPDRIKNAPSLLPGLELYYIGFMDLVASRQMGFGPGPLWWNTIQQYCDHHGIDGYQCEAMHYHLREMDTVYLKQISEKK